VRLPVSALAGSGGGIGAREVDGGVRPGAGSLESGDDVAVVVEADDVVRPATLLAPALFLDCGDVLVVEEPRAAGFCSSVFRLTYSSPLHMRVSSSTYCSEEEAGSHGRTEERSWFL